MNETSVKKIQEDIAGLVSDVNNLRQELGSKGLAKIESMRDEAQEKLGAVRGQAVDTAKHVDKYVHDKPWVVVGAVAAAALLVLALFRGKSRE